MFATVIVRVTLISGFFLNREIREIREINVSRKFHVIRYYEIWLVVDSNLSQQFWSMVGTLNTNNHEWGHDFGDTFWGPQAVQLCINQGFRLKTATQGRSKASEKDILVGDAFLNLKLHNWTTTSSFVWTDI